MRIPEIGQKNGKDAEINESLAYSWVLAEFQKEFTEIIAAGLIRSLRDLNFFKIAVLIGQIRQKKLAPQSTCSEACDPEDECPACWC